MRLFTRFFALHLAFSGGGDSVPESVPEVLSDSDEDEFLILDSVPAHNFTQHLTQRLSPNPRPTST